MVDDFLLYFRCPWGAFEMSQSQIHRLRNLLAVILGGIETNRLELSLQAISQMNDVLKTVPTAPMPDSSVGRWVQ